MPRLRFIAWNRQPDHLWGQSEYRASPVTDFKQTIIAGYARDYDTSSFPHAPSFRLTIRDRFEWLLVCTVNFLWALLTQYFIRLCVYVCFVVRARACVYASHFIIWKYQALWFKTKQLSGIIAFWIMIKYKIKYVSLI